MAKDELEWQQRNTKREIDVLSDDIRGLKQAISDKDKPLEVNNYFSTSIQLPAITSLNNHTRTADCSHN